MKTLDSLKPILPKMGFHEWFLTPFLGMLYCMLSGVFFFYHYLKCPSPATFMASSALHVMYLKNYWLALCHPEAHS